jgi:hypothetical protein
MTQLFTMWLQHMDQNHTFSAMIWSLKFLSDYYQFQKVVQNTFIFWICQLFIFKDGINMYKIKLCTKKWSSWITNLLYSLLVSP